MKSIDKTIRAISRFEVQAPPRLDERVRKHVYEAFASSSPAPAAQIAAHPWRMITSSRITQLAAAAMIAVAALLGLHVWDLGGAEVYAVEQTIEALRKIETAHAFCTNWQGRKFEIWIKPDPATGANDFICLLGAEPNSIVISTPRVSYYYYPESNQVRILRGQLITSDVNLAKMIESLTQEANKKGESVEIGRKVTDRYGDAITIHCAGASSEYEAWIDPKTKLLLGLEYARCDNDGEVAKSLDEIRYNEPVPERLLHFECPDDARIKPEGWGDIDNPKYGIDVSGLSDEATCREILTRLFDAINAPNLNQMRQLVPVANKWNDEELVAAVREIIEQLWEDQTPGVPAYEIGTLYQDKGCPLGVLVPCVLTDHNKQRFEITFIVRFRQTEGRRTCVIVDTWGGMKPRLGMLHYRQPLRVSDSPFEGPINGALPSSQSIRLIVPTHETDKAIQQRIHDSADAVRKLIMGRLPGREVKVLTDVEALQMDLSQSSLAVYGTPQGNLWLAKYITALPVVIEPNRITADRVYEGSDLRFITAWPHPHNPNLGMVIYTAQRAEDVAYINSIFHGPTDYLIAQGKTIVHSADYDKKEGRWTFP